MGILRTDTVHKTIIAAFILYIAAGFCAEAPVELFLQAEDYSVQDSSQGLSNDKTYVTLHGFRPGRWVGYEKVDFGTAAVYTSLKASVFSDKQEILAREDNISGIISYRVNSYDGPVVGEIAFGPNTLPDTNLHVLEITLTNTNLLSGIRDVYITYTGIHRNGIKMDWFSFCGTTTLSSPRTLYVSANNGADTNPGTLDKPFQTIAKASSALLPGDTCLIRGGLYNETLRPVHNGTAARPITYEAYNNEKVVITGCDPLNVAWENYEGNKYKANIAWDLGRGNNELFSGLTRLPEARFPHLSLPYKHAKENNSNEDGMPYKVWVVPPGDAPRDCMHPIYMQYEKRLCGSSDCDNATTTQTTLSFDIEELRRFPTDALVGATFIIRDRWKNKSGLVTKSYSEAGMATIEIYNWKNWEWTQNYCMLIGAPVLVKDEYEWAIQDGICHIKPPAGVKPGEMNLMLKKRFLTADLRYRSYIHLDGLHFLSGALSMIGSRNCTVSGCHFRCLSKYYFWGHRDGNPYYVQDRSRESGFYESILSGSDNVIRRCSFVLSANMGLRVQGENNRVENCCISDMNYAEQGAGVVIGGKNNVVTHCTLHDFTRSAASFGGGAKKDHNGRLEYCNIYNTCLHSVDGGSMYTYSTSAYSAQIAYNWFSKCFIIMQGKHLYFDMVDAGVNPLIHHNVFFPNDISKEAESKFDAIGLKGCMKIYNNTFLTKNVQWEKGKIRKHGDKAGQPYESFGAKLLEFASDSEMIAGGRDCRNNLLADSTQMYWKFTDSINGDYSLQQGSPAIDEGEHIPGITDGYAGAAPDLGAYEFGAPAWKPGHDWGEPRWPELEDLGPGVSSMRTPLAAPIASLSDVRILHKRNRVIVHDPRIQSAMLYDMCGRLMRFLTPENDDVVALSLREIPRGWYVLRIAAAKSTRDYPVMSVGY